ncbi:MAG: 30S ribosomal protein S2 [Beijerinckiaceae bacterium]|jgi:small subunit ribosomal protein S2|nr:30S ribosomal protein S2 [Beijerinckiaceae bacterium]
MALPEFSMRQLLEAGSHFGHQSHRWNPKMGKYIFGVRNNIHVIDLAQTVPLLHQALKIVSDTVAKGGRVLFVGTKRQASDAIAESATRSAQYFINSRWLGGTLTNWKTISASISRLRKLNDDLAGGGVTGLTKKEQLMLSRERERLDKALGGIKDMGGVPDLMFVIDTNKEALAIKEANRLGIPVVAILDTNCDPDGITHPIPGNDDAGRAIALYCDLIARAALDGIARGAGASGVDIGEFEAPVEEALDDAPVAEAEVVVLVSTEDGAAAAAALEVDTAEVFEMLSAPRGAPDELTKITGVGPQLEKRLNEGGIFHYWQLAAMTSADVEKIDGELKLNGRIERDGWVAQVKQLIDAAS